MIHICIHTVQKKEKTQALGTTKLRCTRNVLDKFFVLALIWIVSVVSSSECTYRVAICVVICSGGLHDQNSADDVDDGAWKRVAICRCHSHCTLRGHSVRCKLRPNQTCLSIRWFESKWLNTDQVNYCVAHCFSKHFVPQNISITRQCLFAIVSIVILDLVIINTHSIAFIYSLLLL